MKKDEVRKVDVFQQVQIQAPVMEAWIDSLADIAISLRLQKQRGVVDIEQDYAFVEETGALTMSTTVDGEPVRMVVPKMMWRYCGTTNQSSRS